jgi:hypothetical protein
MQKLGMREPDWRKMMLTLVGMVIGMVILISLLLTLRYRAPRPDKAARLYRSFVKKSGVAIALGESPIRFAARAQIESKLDDLAIETVTADYLQARYGAPDPTSLQRLQQSVNQL